MPLTGGSREARGFATRFAPSPNGRLHLGHVRSALFAARTARRIGGRFILRIEDIDITRSRTEFVSAIFDDLAWLGLTWEEPVLRQSEHFPDYIAAADRLRAMGVLYRCFASRSEIAAAHDGRSFDPDGAPIYPGLHRGMSDDEQARRIDVGEMCAWRIDMEKALEIVQAKLSRAPLTYRAMDERGALSVVAMRPEVWGDAVIVRKEFPASYHLAVVVDDARQGVTHVTRGMDLEPATALHRLLQVLLDLPEPIYCHHGLVMGPDGRKLSKSDGAESVAALRARGASAEEVRWAADNIGS
ncbi:MAG TPA: tRNA glutamyl-Q(34) synthetase GluQRS [Hyphomicrobiaceae bacterium]|nr:tRNA glutamyl-Q(34) synthetase GluQRS [Hyphomicrobiaceae bacterium]